MSCRPGLVSTRGRVGRYLGVPGDSIALVPNATTGVNVALRSLRTRPGQRFVLTNHVYGAVLLAAMRVAEERGCEVVVLDLALDASDDEVVAALAAVVDDATGCIVVDQITSATAKVLPVARVAELGRSLGVPVIVDGAHAPGLLDNPVVGDFWAGNLHKWPCAPRGTGVLHAAPDRWADVVPPVVSWGLPAGFPTSFDVLGTTDASGWLAAPTSLDLLDTLGFHDQRNRLGELVSAGAELFAEAIGGRVVDVGAPAPTMRLVTLPAGLVSDDLEAARLGAYLAPRTGVEVALTSWCGRGFLRLSAHVYNTPDEFGVAAERFAPHFADLDTLMAVSHGG